MKRIEILMVVDHLVEGTTLCDELQTLLESLKIGVNRQGPPGPFEREHQAVLEELRGRSVDLSLYVRLR